MELLVKISDALDRLISRIGRIAAWAGLALVIITIFDVITRRWEATQGLLALNSTQLQELEWHAHVVLFAFCIGFAYLADSHVRIDLLRERFGRRLQWWIELLGCLLFLIPYCVLVVYFSVDFTIRSFQINEISASATGLSQRWIIKSAIPIGFSLLGLAGLVVVLRKIVELFGPPELRRRVDRTEEAEAEHLVDIGRDLRAGGDGGAER